MQCQNLLTPQSTPPTAEIFEPLLEGKNCRLERIVSTGQSTPPDEWYDQETDEWVVLLSGRARLRFENGGDDVEMHPGDYLNIPAHCRHRVEWTDPNCETVWLALHYEPQQEA